MSLGVFAEAVGLSEYHAQRVGELRMAFVFGDLDFIDHDLSPRRSLPPPGAGAAFQRGEHVREVAADVRAPLQPGGGGPVRAPASQQTARRFYWSRQITTARRFSARAASSVPAAAGRVSP